MDGETTAKTEEASAGRRRKRMRRRRQEILHVAARMFAERGYERTTLEMIAGELGLTKPSLYHYIRSKEDVLAGIFRDIFQGILDRADETVSVDQPASDRVRALIVAYAEQACVYPEGRALFLYESHLLGACSPELVGMRDEYQARLQSAIRTGIDAGEFRVTDARLAALAIVGALYCIPLWYLPDGPLSPDQIGVYYAEILIGGLVDPARPAER